MTRMTLYSTVGLTPFRAAVLHVLLIGLPWKFGDLGGWLEQSYFATYFPSYFPSHSLTNPCDIFASKDECKDIDIVSLEDMGARFFLFHNLALATVVIVGNKKSNLLDLHKLMLWCTFGSIFAAAWIQRIFPPLLDPKAWPKLESGFFQRHIFYYTFAFLLSLWTMMEYPSPPLPKEMKWSIPANAIFCGAVINLLVATAAFQALAEDSGVEPGVEAYYGQRFVVSNRVKLEFGGAAFFTLLHALFLWWIRSLLSMPQLRWICFYKVAMNLVLPLFWYPESTEVFVIDRQLAMSLRVGITVAYGLGFLWAGQAEGFSTILSSEKDE